MSKEGTSRGLLHNRYINMLHPLKSADHASEALYEKGFLSYNEKLEIQATLTEELKKKALCNFLTAKGPSFLLKISEILSLKQCSKESGSGVVTTSSSSSSSSTEASVSSSSGSGDGEGEGGHRGRGKEEISETAAGLCQGQDSAEYFQGNGGSVYEGYSNVNNKFTGACDVREREQRIPQLGMPVDGKRMKTDVPDPPVEQLPARTAESAYNGSPQGMEDAFIILFFTFITQQLQILWSNKPRNPSHNPSHHRANPAAQNAEQPGNPSVFPWLQVDVSSEEARDYFPAEVVKSVAPSPGNPACLKLSVLLEGFQQLIRAFESLKQENWSLQRKGRMYDELARKFRALESKMTQMQQAGGCGHSNATPHQMGISDTNATVYRYGHSNATPWNAAPPQMPASSDTNAALRRKVAELEEQAKPLKQAYTRSEERCVQLVEVTQQWAIECEEKVRMIELLEKEAEQLKVAIQQLEPRVTKYKKYWMETKDAPRAGKVSDGQFEELRTELAMRRELYDQVLAQRDEALQKVKVLASEIDNLKDHNVQLVDRAANFKVQAQAKQPSVREMSILLEQKGRLELEVENLRKDKAELSDKTVALEILAQDLTSKVNHLQGAPLKQLQPHSRRADAMVIGYNPPAHLTPNPSPTHIRAPQGSQFLAPSTSSSHYYRISTASSTTEEDDVLSLESSGASSGSFPSHDSNPEKKQTFVRSYSGHSTPSPHTPVPLLKSRDPSSNPELQSCDVPTVPHDTTPRGLEMSPPAFSDDDYTSKIRYPNNSRILVQPLLDEDISLKEGSTEGRLRVRETPGVPAANKEPFYCDRSRFDLQQQFHPPQEKRQVETAPPPNQPTAILPPNSPFFAPATTERKCPVCQHTFLTLSKTEFEAHVAVCFK